MLRAELEEGESLHLRGECKVIALKPRRGRTCIGIASIEGTAGFTLIGTKTLDEGQQEAQETLDSGARTS